MMIVSIILRLKCRDFHSIFSYRMLHLINEVYIGLMVSAQENNPHFDLLLVEIVLMRKVGILDIGPVIAGYH